MRIWLSTLLGLSLCYSAKSQNLAQPTPIAVAQKPLPPTLDSLRWYMQKFMTSDTTKTRVDANNKFIKLLVKTLKEKNSFNFSFDSLKSMSVLEPDDHTFRLFTWQVKQDQGTYRQYGAIQMNDTTKLKLVPLFDNSELLGMNEDTVVDSKNWYGAVYYAIKTVKKGQKPYYTLLGYDAFEPFSQRKVIELLSFNKLGTPVWGSRLFKQTDKRVLARRIFEYSKQVTMTLRFDEITGMVAMDHLVPSKPENKGLYFDYVPDLSYDGYEWKNNQWVLKENIVFKNKSEIRPILNTPKKSGLTPR